MTAVFGIAQPCRHTLEPALRRQWMRHLCGVCLGLRDHAGQSARATTNVDAVLLSVLVEAQRAEMATTRLAGPCPGRGGGRQVVPVSSDGGVVLGVATSLTMAATKVDDHVLDHDGAWTRVPVVPRAVARRWQVRGDRAADAIGFDAPAVRAIVERSNVLERSGARTFAELAAPTEDAAALAFTHTAVVAGRPGNHDALDELGRAFGRIVYLLDAVEDFDDDLAAGRFNPLATFPDPVARRTEARTLFGAAHATIVAAVDRLELVAGREALVRALLVEQVARAGHRVLHGAGHPHCAAGAHHDARPRRQTLRTLAELGIAGIATLTAGAMAFKPGEGPAGPEWNPPVPPPQPPLEEEHPVRDDLVDAGSDCCCELSCCCCCDSCCDSCDCCDCA